MPPPTRAEMAEAARRHRSTADRVLDRTAVGPTRRAYDEEHGETIRAVARAVGGNPQRVTTPSDARRAEIALRRRTSDMLDRMAQSFHETSRETLSESARASARFIARVEGDRGTILHDDEVISRIVQARGYAVDRARSSAMRSLHEQMHRAITDRMRVLSTAEGVTRSELVTGSANVMEENWWRIERTIRTETSFAFNQAQSASIRALADDYPDMLQRWTEMVNDLTGAPLDNRVGQDSLVLHGQVAPVGGMFVMPADPRAPASMVGDAWASPPNRPNDRAVLMPWRRGWGVPAWRYDDGRRVPMR